MNIRKVKLGSDTAAQDLVTSLRETGFAVITNHDKPSLSYKTKYFVKDHGDVKKKITIVDLKTFDDHSELPNSAFVSIDITEPTGPHETVTMPVNTAEQARKLSKYFEKFAKYLESK